MNFMVIQKIVIISIYHFNDQFFRFEVLVRIYFLYLYL